METAIDLIERPMNAMEAELQSLACEDNGRLLEMLGDAFRLTVQGVIRMAAIVRILSDRQYDVAKLKLSLTEYLRQVAAGRLLPEALAKFQAAPLLLSRLETLPISSQKRILDDGVVAVATMSGEVIDVPLGELGRDEIFRVFGQGTIRTPQEQSQYLARKLRPAKTRAGALPRRRVRIDAKTRMVQISNASAPLADFMAALSEAGGRQGDIGPGDVNGPSVGARLTEEERERMRAMCKAMRLDEAEFVRRAILTWLI